MRDNASGANHATVSDRHAGHDLDPCAEPHIITDPDGLVPDQPGIPTLCVNGMRRRMETASRSHEDMVPENDLSPVQDR